MEASRCDITPSGNRGGGFRKVYELGLYGSEVGVLYIYPMEQERWDAEGGRVA